MTTRRTEQDRPWIPVLEGEEAASAEHSVREVARELEAEEWCAARLPFDLASGNAGMAVLFHQIHGRWPTGSFQRIGEERLEAAIDTLARALDVAPSLYTGFTGVGWASLFLSREASSRTGPTDPQEDTNHEELEEALLDRLARASELVDQVDYDLILGAVGWGLYALERWPSPRAQRALELIVDWLEDRVQWVDEGARWPTPPWLLPTWQRELHPEGGFNLGLSHGNPGICVFLAQALQRGIRSSSTSRLLEGSVDWILAQRIQNSTGLSFPSFVRDGYPRTPSRLAWCYGDLGIAIAICLGGSCTGMDRWTREGQAIARATVDLGEEECHVRDAGLCHGSAGVGHVFGRLFQLTGDQAFHRASRRWHRITLESRREGLGPGGYGAWRNEPVSGLYPNAGLLEGSAGIALALLAATGRAEPEWDRFLFVSAVPMIQRIADSAEDPA